MRNPSVTSSTDLTSRGIDRSAGWESHTLGEITEPGLAPEELLVISACLEPGDATFQQLRETLSQDELERAARFRFEAHRRQFIAARGILRTIVSRLENVPAGAVRFHYGEHGKPYIDGDLRFNMSDSGDRAIFAFVRGREVGIDIEKVRQLRDAVALARRFFAEGEAQRVLGARETDRAFFTCWTRKEAYIKARGEGLSMPLDSFEVSVDPADAPRLLSARLDPSETSRWRMEALDPEPGYIAALVVEGPALRMRRVSLRFD